jgi:hypothetical protein
MQLSSLFCSPPSLRQTQAGGSGATVALCIREEKPWSVMVQLLQFRGWLKINNNIRPSPGLVSATHKSPTRGQDEIK